MFEAVKRWFIRMWFLNRNYEVRHHADTLKKAAEKRIDLLMQTPLIRRREFMTNDPVMSVCMDLMRFLNNVSSQTGVK